VDRAACVTAAEALTEEIAEARAQQTPKALDRVQVG
jgi:hypothetical protein